MERYEPETSAGPAMTEDAVEGMIALAERLRRASGGELDEAAVQAVAEATGAPVDYVRLAVKMRSDRSQRSSLARLRAQFLTLDPQTRRWVLSGVVAAGMALLVALEQRLGESVSRYGLLSMFALVLLAGGITGIVTSRDERTAAVGGAILAGGFFASFALFGLLLQLPVRVAPIALLPCLVAGALAGLVGQRLVSRNRKALGLKDPVKERQQLLSQLVELQEKLRSGEQSATFLSVDIVGSTRMKDGVDPLAVEFTFNEYHAFVDRVTRRYGGRVHSTAGDGVTCAFDHPQQAFAAARNLQTGILEVNTFRNRIGRPIVLRAGLHAGTIVAPDASDVRTLEFSSVIDVAAHFQKAAPPGGIAVSDEAAKMLPEGPAGVGAVRVRVDDREGTVWTPRPAAVPSAPATAPPPVPVP